jgi:hypothetical protein
MRRVAAGYEVGAGAVSELRLQLVAGEHRDAYLGDLRWAHGCHRRHLQLTLADAPGEELPAAQYRL